MSPPFRHSPAPAPPLIPLLPLLIISSSFTSLFFFTTFPNANQPSSSSFSNPLTPHDNNNNSLTTSNPPPAPSRLHSHKYPYHDWNYFASDFHDMMQRLKLYVYPHVNSSSSYAFAEIFAPHVNPFNPRLGNYFSEHIFKISLLNSDLVTSDPHEADFFFLPFSINNLRNDPRVRSEAAISAFVADYVSTISRGFGYWNASSGADHFYVHCHSVGREAASKHYYLLNNAIQVTCSASYFQRFYVSHKDAAVPQVWPRKDEFPLTPPTERHRLVFFSGRVQNSRIRQELVDTWGNDKDMDIFSGNTPFPYEEGFKRSKYCLHVKGYEVNTARISDAIHYGCIPVVLSNYYDLPFANVVDWSKFSIIMNHREIKSMKEILLSISTKAYEDMFNNLCRVRRHFAWHVAPRDYDAFYMTAYQLWLRRGMQRLSR